MNMHKISLVFAIVFLALPAAAALNVPITVQEALYPGSVAGVTRTSEPFCQGIPLADSAAIVNTNTLGLTGAVAGQFRILGRWPSGNAKWVEACGIVPSLTGGGTTTVTLTDSGSGNFGGSNLATDNGTTITVATGAATFSIRKARFNVVDQAVVGGTTVVASGSSQGLVITGPPANAGYPANVTCTSGSCTVPYMSSNDPNSTCVVEKNGPVQAVLKCSGDHVDASGNVYLHFTVREYFYLGKTAVKVTSILRNADYGTSNTFATAYKGHQGYELRLTPSISGTTNYSFGNHTSAPTTGTLTSSDNIYLYQGESQQLKWQDWCGSGCVPFTNDTGYSIVKNGSTLTSGVDTQYPQGWADISNSSGTGIEIGVYQLSAYWPKSLEFNAGGTDVRIGIWARQNSQAYYQAWPQWNIHDLYLNFHATTPASPANEFLKFQHYLLARAPYTHYNSTGVFPYTLIDPSVEDSFYASTASSATPSTIPASSACCIKDLGTSDISHWPLNIYRFYAWHAGGGANQTEFRWSGLLNFITRGMTGRYLDASHFYRMQSEITWPHSDGFNWRDRPHANQGSPELDGFGFPTAASANSNLAISKDWLDQEHGHWYGMTDYYFMTGDETTHDALLDGPKDWFLNPDTYQNGAAGGLYNSRSIGVQLIGAARFSQFLTATGDPDAPGVLSQGANTYAVQVKPDLCVSGYPNGCSVGQIDANLGGSWTTQGVSRVRGVPWGAAGTSGSWCGVSHAYRVNSSFQPAILIQGLLEYRNVQGPAWPEYVNALDLAYGIARWDLSENFVDNGTGRWDVNGFRFGLALDRANSCTGAGESPEPDFQPTPTQTTSMAFLAKYLVDGDTSWTTKFKINLQKDMSALGTTTSDLGSYQLAHVVGIINNPGSTTLNTVPISSFADNGGGSYTVAWTVPPGAQSYRIKWGAKAIVDWIGFDPTNNVFTGDPVNTMPWFAANNVASTASPSTSGSTQSFTISTGVTGLTAANFSVKAYVSGSSTISSGPTNLILVSGNGQSGTPGQTLANPLTVEVTDSAGNGVSGVTVAFAVTSGGGSVSAASVVTNSSGLASTTLILGATAGANTVRASAGTLAGSPLTFTATGTAAGPGPAANLVLVSGNGQSGTAGQPLASPFTVRVTDSNGNAVSGATVTFAVVSGGGALSATTVTTNSLGIAASTLVLGTIVGTNTVTATSGTLAGSPITFTATGTSSSSGANVTWTNPAPTLLWPSYVGWITLPYDPVSRQTLIYAGPPNGVHGIYSTDLYAYNSTTNVFTHIAGTGSTQDSCPADTATLPGDRHPLGQMAIDTRRNVLWLYGGLDVSCSSASGPNANPRQDMYYLTLNSNPALDTWHQISPAHIPLANSGSAMVYDPDDDILFAFGSDIGSQTKDNWVYCRTAENPSPGTLTAKQSVAGCSAPDDWTQIIPVGGIQPPAVNFPGMVYDPVTKKVILYGGMSSGLTISYNQIWTYDVPTRTWTQRALSTTAPPVYAGSNVAQPALAYNSSTGKVLYHQTSGAGAPADWQYDPVADTWTKLVSAGGGATADQYLTYDTLNNRLIGFNLDTNTGLAAIWQGALSTSTTARSCDLNQDSIVNVLDVQIAANQVLGVATCGSADLNGDGVCTVTDLQRVVNASLGTACVVGQ
jgi:hypothetical protein